MLFLMMSLLPLSCGADGNATDARESPPSKRHSRLVKDGDAAREKGDYAQAIDLYREAAGVQFHESPNYEVLARLADAYCRDGNTAVGLKLLDDFSCMLDAQGGEVACFGADQIGYLGERNQSLSDLCFETMCSEAYLSYYESPVDSVRARVRELRKEAATVRASCTAPHAE